MTNYVASHIIAFFLLLSEKNYILFGVCFPFTTMLPNLHVWCNNFQEFFLKAHLDHAFLFENFDTSNLEIFLKKLVILA
jgi:hypothetical protein